MRTLIQGVIRSLPALVNVMAMFLFCFSLFGILALEMWGSNGMLYHRCRTTPFPVIDNHGAGKAGGLAADHICRYSHHGPHAHHHCRPHPTPAPAPVLANVLANGTQPGAGQLQQNRSQRKESPQARNHEQIK